jgi:hypothetical protein
MEKKHQKYLLYAAVAAGVYFLFFKNSSRQVMIPKAKASEGKNASYAVEMPEEKNDPAGGLMVPTMESGLIDINNSNGAELLGLQANTEAGETMAQ